MSAMSIVCQPQSGQRRGREADAESLQCRPTGDGLGHGFGQFIEFVVHDFPFHFGFLVSLFGHSGSAQGLAVPKVFEASNPMTILVDGWLPVLASRHRRYCKRPESTRTLPVCSMR
jgi:hypothetical protein